MVKPLMISSNTANIKATAHSSMDNPNAEGIKVYQIGGY